MATQTELTSRPSKSRANSHSHIAQVQPEIDSTALVTRRFVEPLTEEQRHELIAVAAYRLAEGRNFEPGHEAEDWMAAEAQVRSLGTEGS
jgi:hypothetical protein